MTDWLFDTLIWTAALIALVLIFRRPVSRYFGPNAAYALWAIPLLRLILPPVVLPSWLAPAAVPVAQISYTTVTIAETAALPVQAATASSSIDWVLIALAVWLIGAVLFLGSRFSNYFRLRAELLDGAHPVGQSGSVRMVETPATNSPIAFGVIDKVVALPEGFMALTDKKERDLALEHELSHHKAHDLFANFAVQPLFALHWFNPLAWYGWRAMRRDQEAACDARVIAARGGEEKAAYASVIAGFAAGPNAAPKLALAAPMACPVIGEKSIIHRLRSLTMSDISPRRKMAGRVLLGAAVLALPLTASISYAESMTTPSAPPAPVAAPTAPSPLGNVPPAPAAPAALPFALQAAPEAPVAPEAPEVSEHETRVFVVRDQDSEKDGVKTKTITRRITINGDKKMTDQEREELIAELREELADVDVDVREAMEEVRLATIQMDKDGAKTTIKTSCKGGKKSGESTSADGKRVIHICTSEVMANALTGLKAARKSIADSSEMPKDMRAEVLKALDEKIADWASEG